MITKLPFYSGENTMSRRSSRSLLVKQECIDKVKNSFKRSDYVRQNDLAIDIGVSRDVVCRFLNGKAVDFSNFCELCFTLSLEWQEVANLEEDNPIEELQIQGTLHRADWGNAPEPVNSSFYGRIQEQENLKRWILQENCNVIAITGLIRVGKTYLVSKVAREIASEFEFVIWRSPNPQHSLIQILKELLEFLTNDKTTNLQDIDSYIEQIVFFFREHRCLLILNSMQNFMQPGEELGAFQKGYENYTEIMRRLDNQNLQSSLVWISREPPKYISIHAGQGTRSRLLQLGKLELEAARNILQNMKLSGSREEETTLIEQYASQPMFVRIASVYVQQLCLGEIRKFLGIKAPIVINGIRKHLDEAFERLSDQEIQVINWLAINWEPSTESMLQEVIYIAPNKLRSLLLLLRRRSLVEVTDEVNYQLPYYIREYVISELIEKAFTEITTGEVGILNAYPLVQAEATDYIRSAQTDSILDPIFTRLKGKYGNYRNLESSLKNLLTEIRKSFHHQVGYAAANLLTLMKRTLIEFSTSRQPTLKDYDFSDLIIRQADLRGMLLRNINFSRADLAESIFYEPFGGILSVDLSLDGEYLSAGDASHKAYVWKLTNNQFKLHRIYAGHTHWVRTVAISPDNQYLAGGGEDLTVRVWDLQTGETLQVLRGYDRRIRLLVFSPDGQYLVSGSDDGTVVLWGTTTWSRVGTHTLDSYPEKRRFRSVTFNRKGNLLVAANQAGEIYTWNIHQDVELRQPRLLHCTDQLLRTVALHPEEEILASGGDDGIIRLWDFHTGHFICPLTGHTNWIRKVIFSPDGRYLASSSEDGTVRIWDIRTYELCQVLTEHTSRVWEISFSPDSQTLVSGSDDQQIKLWNLKTGVCLTTLQGYTCKLRSVAFSADGQSLASGGDDHMIRIWDVNSGICTNQLEGHQGRVWSVSFNAQQLVSGSDDQTVKYWDMATSQCIQTIRKHTSWVRTVTTSPDHKLIASGGDDKIIRVFNLETHESNEFELEHTDWILSLVFSPDGQSIISGSDDGTVKIWNVKTGKCIQTLREHSSSVRAVAISPDSHWVASGSNDKTVRLYNSQELLHDISILGCHNDWVRCLDFHPKRPILASGSYDQKVILWDIISGNKIRSLIGHEAAVISISFSPNGRFLATGSEDETIKIWDIETGHLTSTMRIPRPYEGVRVTDICGLTKEQISRLIWLGALQ